LDFQEERLKECIRSKFPKNSEVTRTKISEQCKIPWQTVDNHYADLIGQNLGDGTKLIVGKVVHDAVIRDPPEDKEVVIEVEIPEDRPPNNDWEVFAIGAIAGGVIATSIALIALAFRKPALACSLVPLQSADSWVRVCPAYGALGSDLNDQSAPIHFSPISS